MDKIQKMVDILVSEFHPREIILFGSRATGNATDDSDVDLLVVSQDENTDTLEQTADMMLAVAGLGLPKDFVVQTPKQFEQDSAIPWTVAHEALAHGIKMHSEAGH